MWQSSIAWFAFKTMVNPAEHYLPLKSDKKKYLASYDDAQLVYVRCTIVHFDATIAHNQMAYQPIRMLPMVVPLLPLCSIVH